MGWYLVASSICEVIPPHGSVDWRLRLVPPPQEPGRLAIATNIV